MKARHARCESCGDVLHAFGVEAHAPTVERQAELEEELWRVRLARGCRGCRGPLVEIERPGCVECLEEQLRWWPARRLRCQRDG